jgi:hypothetical protein
MKAQGDFNSPLLSVRFHLRENDLSGWDGWTRTNEMPESKSGALPAWLHPNIIEVSLFKLTSFYLLWGG